MNTPDMPQIPLKSQFSDDPDMAELIALFITELPERVEAIRAAQQSGAGANLKRISHQLKGASAGYGFPTIGAAAAKVEDGLRAGGSDESQALERVRAEVDELVNLCRRAMKGS